MGRRKVKNGVKSPWWQCLTRSVSNSRGRSCLWLVPENFCDFLPNQRGADLGVVSCVLTRRVNEEYMKFRCSPLCLSWLFAEVKDSLSEQNAREKFRNICDYLHRKYAGPFAGIITVAYLKVCENIHWFTDVSLFWMQGYLKLKFLESLSTRFFWFFGSPTCSDWNFSNPDNFFCRTGQAHHVGMSSDRQPDTYIVLFHDFLSEPKGKNSGRVYLHNLTKCAELFSLKLKLSIQWQRPNILMFML